MTADESTTPESKRYWPGGLVDALCDRITTMNRGDIAALRRMRANDYACSAYFKLCVTVLKSEIFDDDRVRLTRERHWSVLTSGLARLVAGSERKLHQPRSSLGRALARCNYSEARFTRLLRARGDALEVELRRLADFLAAKGERADWAQASRLLIGSPRRRDAVRLDLAREYYSPTATKHDGQEN